MSACGEGYCPSSRSSALCSARWRQHDSEHRCHAVSSTAQPPDSEPAARKPTVQQVNGMPSALASPPALHWPFRRHLPVTQVVIASPVPHSPSIGPAVPAQSAPVAASPGPRPTARPLLSKPSGSLSDHLVYRRCPRAACIFERLHTLNFVVRSRKPRCREVKRL